MADTLDIKFLNSHEQIKKFCKNSSQNIEDPIFTGFTFTIDEEHSPLFYNGKEYYTPETLRSPDGEDTSLAQKIEDKLKQVNDIDIIGTPNGYDITTLNVKDSFGGSNERKPGYGLWEEHYMDKVLYGAVDYIYMVDKVADSAFSGTDFIGNGTPNTSVYDTYAEELSAANIFFDLDKDNIRSSEEATIAYIVKTLTDNPELQVTLSGYADVQTGNPQHNSELSKNRVYTVKHELIKNKIDESRITTAYYGDTVQPFSVNEKNRAVICKFIGELGKEEQETLLDMNIQNVKANVTNEMNAANKSKEENLETIKNNYIKKLNEYKQFTKLEDLENQISDEKIAVKSKLSGYKSTVEKKLELLKTSSDDDIRNTIKIEVEKIWNEFKSMVGDVSSDHTENYGDNLEVEYKFPDEKTINDELSLIKKNSQITDSNEVIYHNIIVMMKTNINKISVKSKSNEYINEYKKEKQDLEKELFGTGTEANPTAIKKQNGELVGSLGYLYKKAKEEYESDPVTNINNYVDLLNDTKANIDNTNEYQNRNSGRQNMRRNTPPSSDTGGESSSKTVKEVPQTVYDILGFIYGMEKLTKEYPYVFQEVTGLEEAYKKYFEIKDPHMGSGDDKITINCLEFLDMRVSSMFNKYLNATYDRQYRRERVPVNLRRFNCSIFIHDIRNFRNSISNILNSGDLFTIAELALNYMSVIEFKFFDCEIVPEETGSILNSVSNINPGEMRRTNFTFTYGNCAINFLPFNDLQKYVLNGEDIKPVIKGKEDAVFDTTLDGNFRRWFDKSIAGNVNNNDYRDYIRYDSSVAVDDHYKTTVVNNFALGSVAQKNKELTQMDNALRRIVTGIAASTGIPTEGVADALNVGFIKQILDENDKAAPVLKRIGNVNNSTIIDTKTTNYIGNVIDEEPKEPKSVKDLGNVNEKKRW